MSYKGSDLNLRTRSALPIEPDDDRAFVNVNAAADAIDVDDLVLACCNAAYDVALFHGSSQVRPEHLLHAMTRVGAAADMLTGLGIRTGHLRRETAMAIAAETPTQELREPVVPHTSAAMRDALSRAAHLASKDQSRASLYDLLRTLLGGGPDSPAASLLMRAAADPRRLERWREGPRREALASVAALASVDGGRALTSGIADALFKRLDDIEASTRALREEAAADRKAAADLYRLVQHELQALRVDRSSFAGVEDIPHVDPLLAGRLEDLSRGVEALTHRVGAIDRGQPGSQGEAQLADLGAAVARLGERFEAVEARWSERAATGGEIPIAGADELAGQVGSHVAGTLSKQLAAAERGVQRLRDELAEQWSAAGERQVALDASLRAQLGSAEEASKAHSQGLTEIYEALVKLGSNQQTLGSNFSTWRLETSGDVAIIGNRLQRLEEMTQDLVSRFGAELQMMRQDVGNGAGRGSRFKRWLYGTNSVFAAGWRDDRAHRDLPAAVPAPEAKS